MMQNLNQNTAIVDDTANAPVELSLDQLRQVVGGLGPNDSWAVARGPNDSWLTTAGPNDNW